MRAEAHIPLFLWVTAALVVHAIFGGGATEVARRIEETLDIRDFAADVRKQARYAGSPVEVSLIPEEDLENEPETPDTRENVENSETDDTTEEEVDQEQEPEQREPEQADLKPVDPPDRPEEEEEKPEEKQQQEKEPAKPVPELELPKPPPSMQPDRRVAVEQHVEDENQEDNPDAEFIAEHANRVEEQTRAEVTATDSNTSEPTMSGPSQGQGPEAGNSEQDRLAQSDEAAGAPDRPAGEAGSDAREETSARAAARSQEQAARAAQQAAPAAAGQAGQKAREAIARSEAHEAMPHTHQSENGSFGIARARQAQEAAKAQKAREAIAGIDKKKQGPLLGLGASGLTPNGVNLNLSHQGARAIIGADEIAQMRKKDGERRLSEHRGGWTQMGLERWKPALENYVATVKPGNQTALNTAHSPFARYLNQIHQRLHQVFAFRFLSHLDKLPSDHPLNNMDINTHLEIALDPRDGNIVKMGVTKSSGVTAFDVGALDSVEKAAPYGPPPSSIVSFDGNVYLHWEFHRDPTYACSTYNAHPYILDAGQKSAPPRVAPPKKPEYEEKPKKQPDKRSGSRSEDVRRGHQPG